jgi:hypothetical protein
MSHFRTSIGAFKQKYEIRRRIGNTKPLFRAAAPAARPQLAASAGCHGALERREEAWPAAGGAGVFQGRFQGLRYRGTSAKMPFICPILLLGNESVNSSDNVISDVIPR